MKIKITLLTFLIITFVSCKKDNSSIAVDNNDLIKDAETNVIIRPIPNEVLETLDDSIKLYYTKLNKFEIQNYQYKKEILQNSDQLKEKIKENGLTLSEFRIKELRDTEEDFNFKGVNLKI